MYGQNAGTAAVLPATGLGLWSGSLAIFAVLLLVVGFVTLWRSYRQEHRP